MYCWAIIRKATAVNRNGFRGVKRTLCGVSRVSTGDFAGVNQIFTDVKGGVWSCKALKIRTHLGKLML